MYNLIRSVNQPMNRRGFEPARTFEDAFFRNFFEMAGVEPLRSGVRETEKGYAFEAELPGFEPGEIDISVRDNQLTVTAKHEEGGETAAYGARRELTRTFSLEGIDAEHIAAQYRNGILRVEMPKQVAEETAPRKIELQ